MRSSRFFGRSPRRRWPEAVILAFRRSKGQKRREMVRDMVDIQSVEVELVIPKAPKAPLNSFSASPWFWIGSSILRRRVQGNAGKVRRSEWIARHLRYQTILRLPPYKYSVCCMGKIHSKTIRFSVFSYFPLKDHQRHPKLHPGYTALKVWRWVLIESDCPQQSIHASLACDIHRSEAFSARP